MIGEAVGNYRVTSKLGEGGMGAVYMAEHQTLGKKAVVKVLLPELSHNKDLVARFFNEARAATQIKHPGIVEVFDFGQLSDGAAYIAMEFLEGGSLAAFLKGHGRMETGPLVAFGRQMTSALAAAHAKGIVHRDLKPDNIYLVPDPDMMGGYRVKILDFGIAKLHAAGDSVKTRTGSVMGTPMYMSPEQCRSSGDVDARSDIYAIGCVLFEMACGRPPFVSDAFGELIAAHMMSPPPEPRSLVPTIPPALEQVILHALAKKVDERPQTMAQLKAELEQAVGARATGEQAVVRSEDATAATYYPMGPSSQPSLGPSSQPSLKSAPRITPPPSTTLNRAAGEIAQTLPPAPQSRAPIYGAIVAGVVVLGVGGFVFLRPAPAPVAAPAAPSSAVVPAAAPPAAAAPAAPAPVAPVAAKPEAAAPKKVRLTIESEPAGAAIYRERESASIGATPKELELDAADGKVEFTLRLDGYGSEKLSMPLDRDGIAKAKLRAKSSGSRTSKPAADGTGFRPVSDDGKPAPSKKIGDGTYNPFGQ